MAIDSRWVYKRKPSVTQNKGEELKICLVAKGYEQHKRIDYDEIFSLVSVILLSGQC